MKQRKCPYRGNLCYDYGACEECEFGTLISKYESKIKRSRNKTIRLEKQVRDIPKKIFKDLI